MDWGTRHLTIILGTGGGTFANRRADHLTIFSNARGLSEGEGGGACSRDLDQVVQRGEKFIPGINHAITQDPVVQRGDKFIPRIVLTQG